MYTEITNPSFGHPDAPDLNRHQPKCEIYNHPDRDETPEFPNQFLIDTPAIRNELNSLKTNDSDSV